MTSYWSLSILLAVLSTSTGQRPIQNIQLIVEDLDRVRPYCRLVEGPLANTYTERLNQTLYNYMMDDNPEQASLQKAVNIFSTVKNKCTSQQDPTADQLNQLYGTITDVEFMLKNVKNSAGGYTLRQLKLLSADMSNRTWDDGSVDPIDYLSLADMFNKLSQNLNKPPDERNTAAGSALLSFFRAMTDIQVLIQLNTEESVDRVGNLLLKAYQNLEFDDILKLIRNVNLQPTQRVTCLSYLFGFLKGDNKERSLEGLILAHDIQQMTSHESFHVVSHGERTKIDNVINQLPKSIYNIAFSPVVRMQCATAERYLQVEKEDYDVYRRKVSGNQKPSGQVFEWKLERLDQETNKYYIKNARYGEYLMPSVLDIDQDRRMVFTWKNKSKPSNGVFYLLPSGDHIQITTQNNEYLGIMVTEGLNKTQTTVYVEKNQTEFYHRWNRTAKAVNIPLWRIEPQ